MLQKQEEKRNIVRYQWPEKFQNIYIHITETFWYKGCIGQRLVHGYQWIPINTICSSLMV